MSFWNQWGITSSHIDTVLSSDDCTLERLLDEEDILQETTSGNEKLLSFLTKSENMKRLLGFVMNEPLNVEQDADPQIRKYKYPYLACEILVAEVFSIVDTIFNDKELLGLLFSYFERDKPLPPLHTTYTGRVATIMLQARVGECVSFLKEKKGFVGNLLKHVDNSAVIDLLAKFIECETASEGVHGISQWFVSEGFVETILGKFDPKEKDVVHENCSQILSVIINANTLYIGPIISQLESRASVQKLIDVLTSGESISIVTSVSSVLVSLVKRPLNEGGPLDPKRKFEELSNVLQVVSENLYKIPQLLKKVPKELKNYQDIEQKGCRPSISPMGPPLGLRRLKLVELCSAMICTPYEAVDAAVIKSDVLEAVIELLFIHQWNNVLHLEIEQMIACILEKNNEELKLYLLKECKLLDRIVEASNLNEEAIAVPRGVRRGNMGHITTIAKAIGKHSDWEKYKDGILSDTVERNRTAYGTNFNQDERFVQSSIEVSLSLEDTQDMEEEEGPAKLEFKDTQSSDVDPK